MSFGPRLVILGKQGAGKGTQCVRLAGHYVIPHISTGDIFRGEMRSDTEYGRALRASLGAGELVPDEIVLAVVARRLEVDETKTHGFILDGFPRTIAQAEQLSKLLAPLDVELAVDLEIPTEFAVERLAGRRVCRDCQTIYGPSSTPRMASVCDYCGGEVVQRDDDTEDAIRRRLSLYELETSPIIDWYQRLGILVSVDGSGPPDEVTKLVIEAVDRRRRNPG